MNVTRALRPIAPSLTTDFTQGRGRSRSVLLALAALLCALTLALVAPAPAHATGSEAALDVASASLDSVVVSPQKTETADDTMKKVTLTAAANVDGVAEGDLSYQWQTYGDDGWADVSGATSPTYDAPVPSKCGTARYKCLVTFDLDGEAKTVESAEATVGFIPAAPVSLTATGSLKGEADLSWMSSDGGKNKVTYEVAWRAVGTENWTTTNVSGESLKLTDLASSTVYEWRVRAIADADKTLISVWSVTSSFLTLGENGLTMAIVSPSTVSYDKGSNFDVTFTVQTDTLGEDLEYTWKWAAPGQSSFTKVDLNDSRFTVDGATLTVKSFFAKIDGAHGTRYQCIVSTGEGVTLRTVTSEPAVLAHKTDPPEKLAAGGTSLTSATLSWADGNGYHYSGTYTLEYRKVQSAVPSLLKSALPLDAKAADGAWAVAEEGISLDPKNSEYSKTYELKGLEPGTSYEWRVQFVTEAGNVGGAWSYGPSFTTLSASALETVEVKPAATVMTDPAETPLTATTNVDGDDTEVLTYQWQTLVGTNWVEAPNAVDASTYAAPAPETYGTAHYRCVVIAQKNGDEKTVEGSEATVALVPAVPESLKASDVVKDAAALSWTMPQTHGDVRYEVAWRAKGGEWTTEPSTEPAYKLAELEPSTSYEWRVRTVATADDALASAWSDTASFVTLGTSGLSKVSVTPTRVDYDKAAPDDVVFEAQTDAPGENLVYTWQVSLDEGANWTDISAGDSRFQADGAKLTVLKTFAETDLAHGSLFRCIVRTGEGVEEREATSEPAVLAHKLAEPVPQAPEEVSAVTAELSWTDDNTHEGTYTLEYRKAAAAKSKSGFRAFAAAPSSSSDTAADEGWIIAEEPIKRDSTGTTTYVLKGLEPGATYEWRVKFVTDRGGIEGDYVYGEPFGTLLGSALGEVEVTPELTVADAGQEVELEAVTNVDADKDEHLTYQWQSALRGGETWTDVSEAAGGTKAKLTVTVGDADLGVRYRCVVVSEKNGVKSETFTSNEAVIWARFDVVAPENLAATDVTQTSAKLSWTCDVKVQGTYTVEYWAKGSADRTTVAGLASQELTIEGLSPDTVYEWCVTHVIVEGLASDAVAGPDFTTPTNAGPGDDPGTDPGDNPGAEPGTVPGTDPGSGSGQGGNGGSSATGNDAAKATALASTGDSVFPVALALAGCALAALVALTTVIIRRRSLSS